MYLPTLLLLGNYLALAPVPQAHLKLPVGEGKAEWYEDKLEHSDLYGDPMPEGAVARIGTDRLVHDNTVLDVAFSPDGRMLAAANHEAVRLSDAATGKALARFTARVSSFNHVAFLPRSKFLVAQSYEGHILFWELTPGQGRPLRGPTTDKYSYFALFPDGKRLAFVREGTIRLWDVRSGEEVGRLGERGTYYRLAVSSDGKLLASQGSEGVTLWDVLSGKALCRLPHVEEGDDPIPFGGRQRQPLINFALSADGKILAGLVRDDRLSQHAVHVWETATGKALHVLKVTDAAPRAMAVSADGNRVAVEGQNGLQVWDVRTGESRWHVSVFGLQFFAVGFSPDGRLLATGLIGRVKLWDAETGRERFPIPEHREDLGFVALSANGRTVLTARLPERGMLAPGDRETPSLRYWEAATGRRLPSPTRDKRFPPFTCLSADQRTLATQGEEGVQVCDVESGEKLSQLPQKVDPEVSALSDDGKLLAVGFHEGRVRYGSPAHLELWDARAGKRLGECAGHNGFFGELRFSPDGKVLACIDNGDRALRMWDVATRKELFCLKSKQRVGYHLAFSRDSRTLALPGLGAEVTFIEVPSGKELSRMSTVDPARKQPYVIFTLLFSPDGKRLFTTDWQGGISVWDRDTGRLLKRWQPGPFGATKLDLSADGKVLLTQGGNSALIWNLDVLLR
jgi:WD40 repeat protein